jgi:hypothetical protein
MFLIVLGYCIGNLFSPESIDKNNSIKTASILNSKLEKKMIPFKIIDKSNPSNTSSLIHENRKKVKWVQKVTTNNNITLSKDYNTSTKQNFDELIIETRNWIQQHESPIQFANYTNTQDSIDQIVAERFLMTSIIKSYQLKRAVMEQRLSSAKDMTEVIDFYMHSKEWDAIAEYEKWAQEYLGRHQQPIGLPSTTTKQQIQY